MMLVEWWFQACQAHGVGNEAGHSVNPLLSLNHCCSFLMPSFLKQGDRPLAKCQQFYQIKMPGWCIPFPGLADVELSQKSIEAERTSLSTSSLKTYSDVKWLDLKLVHCATGVLLVLCCHRVWPGICRFRHRVVSNAGRTSEFMSEYMSRGNLLGEGLSDPHLGQKLWPKKWRDQCVKYQTDSRTLLKNNLNSQKTHFTYPFRVTWFSFATSKVHLIGFLNKIAQNLTATI